MGDERAIPPMIVALEKRHDRGAFDCGVAEMNRFLREQARQDGEKGMSRTFVYAEGEENTIRGFYTIAFATIRFEEMPAEKRLSRYPAPVALLAQLAVDVAHQGQGLGERLLFDAMARTVQIAAQIGVFALVLDARDDNLIDFYARYGFGRAEAALEPRRMYLKISAIRQLDLPPV